MTTISSFLFSIPLAVGFQLCILSSPPTTPAQPEVFIVFVSLRLLVSFVNSLSSRSVGILLISEEMVETVVTVSSYEAMSLVVDPALIFKLPSVILGFADSCSSDCETSTSSRKSSVVCSFSGGGNSSIPSSDTPSSRSRTFKASNKSCSFRLPRTTASSEILVARMMTFAI